MSKKKFTFLSLFLSLFFLIILLVVTYLPKKNTIINSRAASYDSGGTSLEPYCQNGYYKIPGEIICSRAPGCGGFTYAQVNTVEKEPDKSCLDNGVIPGNPNSAACKGYPPACCYEMARTGDFTKCVGYWERLWCSPDLCQQAERNGATDNQCGGCQCAHAYEFWCAQKGPINKAVPIEVRLGFTAPSPTSTPPSSTSTPPPLTTAAPIPSTTPIPPTLPPQEITPTTASQFIPIPTTESSFFQPPSPTLLIPTSITFRIVIDNPYNPYRTLTDGVFSIGNKLITINSYLTETTVTLPQTTTTYRLSLHTNDGYIFNKTGTVTFGKTNVISVSLANPVFVFIKNITTTLFSRISDLSRILNIFNLPFQRL